MVIYVNLKYKCNINCTHIQYLNRHHHAKDVHSFMNPDLFKKLGSKFRVTNIQLLFNWRSASQER